MQNLYRDLRKWLGVGLDKKRKEKFFSNKDGKTNSIHPKVIGSECFYNHDSTKTNDHKLNNSGEELKITGEHFETNVENNVGISESIGVQEKIITTVIMPEKSVKSENQIEENKRKTVEDVAKHNAEPKLKEVSLKTAKEEVRHLADGKNINREERPSKWSALYEDVMDNKWVIYIFLGCMAFILFNVLFSKEPIYDEKEWPEIKEQQLKNGLLESVHLLDSEQKKKYSLLFREQEKDTFLVFVYSLRDNLTNQIKNDCALIKIAKDIQPKYVVNIRKNEDLVSFAFCKPDNYIKTEVESDCFVNGSIHSRILKHYKGEKDSKHNIILKDDILEIIPPNYRSKIGGAGNWYEIPPQLPLSEKYQSISINYIVRHAINKGLKWMIWGAVISFLFALVLLWEKYKKKDNGKYTYGMIFSVALLGSLLSFILGYVWCAFQNLLFIIDYLVN